MAFSVQFGFSFGSGSDLARVPTAKYQKSYKPCTYKGVFAKNLRRVCFQISVTLIYSQMTGCENIDSQDSVYLISQGARIVVAGWTGFSGTNCAESTQSALSLLSLFSFQDDAEES